MDNITLGQIKDVVVWLCVIVGSIGTLYKLIMSGINKILTPMKQETKKQLDEIKDDIRDERKERLKSDLTTFMYLAEHGDLSNDQKLRAHEEYDMYVGMGGNSWVHDRFEIVKKEGKI